MMSLHMLPELTAAGQLEPLRHRRQLMLGSVRMTGS